MPRKKRTYKTVKGSRVRAKDAQCIGERLATLSDRAGRLAPDVVVEDAKNKKSPLHSYFTWDDTDAARLHRLEEARLLTRGIIEIRVEDVADAGPLEFRAFVQMEGESDDAPYMQTIRVLKDPEMRKILVARALSELRSWRERYNHLKELADIFDAIDRHDG